MAQKHIKLSNFLKICFKIFLSLCYVYGFFSCLYMQHVCFWYPQKPGEVAKSLGTGVKMVSSIYVSAGN